MLIIFKLSILSARLWIYLIALKKTKTDHHSLWNLCMAYLESCLSIQRWTNAETTSHLYSKVCQINKKSRLLSVISLQWDYYLKGCKWWCFCFCKRPHIKLLLLPCRDQIVCLLSGFLTLLFCLPPNATATPALHTSLPLRDLTLPSLQPPSFWSPAPQASEHLNK